MLGSLCPCLSRASLALASRDWNTAQEWVLLAADGYLSTLLGLLAKLTFNCHALYSLGMPTHCAVLNSSQPGPMLKIS